MRLQVLNHNLRWHKVSEWAIWHSPTSAIEAFLALGVCYYKRFSEQPVNGKVNPCGLATAKSRNHFAIALRVASCEYEKPPFRNESATGLLRHASTAQSGDGCRSKLVNNLRNHFCNSSGTPKYLRKKHQLSNFLFGLAEVETKSSGTCCVGQIWGP